MSADQPDKTFFDTNVLVYLFDKDSPAKQERSRSLLEEYAGARRLVVSAQVLSELFVTLTRKFGKSLSPAECEEIVREISAVSEVVPLDAATVLAGVARTRQRGLSYWDALIVESALAAGCVHLFSEDLQDGRRIESLRIENPFR
jgi:predicted nucleic acid-binding protein